MKINIYYRRDLIASQFKSDPEVDLNFVLFRGRQFKAGSFIYSPNIKLLEKFQDIDKVIILANTYEIWGFPRLKHPIINLKDVRIKSLTMFHNFKYQCYNFIYVHFGDVKTPNFASLILPTYINIVITQVDIDPYVNDYIRVYTDATIDIIIQKNNEQQYYWKLTNKFGIKFFETKEPGQDLPYLQIESALEI